MTTTLEQRAATRALRRTGRPIIPASTTPAQIAALLTYTGHGTTTEQSHAHEDGAPCDCPIQPDGPRVMLLDVHDSTGEPRQFVIHIQVEEVF